jgi:hypothetical protein
MSQVSEEVSAQTTGRVISTALHQIDIDQKSCVSISTTNQQEDLENYLDDLLLEIQNKEQKREYSFTRETTEFFTTLTAYTKDKNLQINDSSNKLAERLLDKEVSTDAKYGHLSASGSGHVKKGSFLQFLFREGNSISYLGVKIDHQSFLDEEDLKRKIGIAISNKIYKACKVSFDTDNIPKEVFIYDTNYKPSLYWWNDFLELKEVRNDAHNTREASSEVIKVINRIKKDHPADYTILRNAVISSFKQTKEFRYSDFLQNNFLDYEPEDKSLKEKFPSIIKNLQDLPKKKGFDTQFNCVPSEVKFRKTNIDISREITLTIKDGIENLNEKIWSEKTKDGKRVVVIEASEEAFSKFHEKTRL